MVHNIVSPSLLGSFIRIFFSLHNTTITMHTQRPDYWRFWAPNAGSGPWHRNGRSENWRKCRLFIGFPMFHVRLPEFFNNCQQSVVLGNSLTKKKKLFCVLFPEITSSKVDFSMPTAEKSLKRTSWLSQSAGLSCKIFLVNLVLFLSRYYVSMQ